MAVGAPVVCSIAEIRTTVAKARLEGREIAFVPTMGALHAGHAALIEAAHSSGHFSVASIFVNPTQFGPNEDYSRYPRTLDEDRRVATEAGVDVLFVPTANDIYTSTHSVYVDIQGLGERWEGKSRPGHFRGVCTIVAKLFNIVQPDVAYFGAKDAQQVRVIRQMVGDLNFPVALNVVPTVRESDGLALSSRNRYLSPSERSAAPGIYNALVRLKNAVSQGEVDCARLESSLKADLEQIPDSQIDYAAIVDDQQMKSLRRLDQRAIAIVAVKMGNTRLIDNIELP